MSLAKVKEDIKRDFTVSTLHDCSYDDSGKVNLVENDWVKVYDFDAISQKWTNDRVFTGCTKPTSPDSIFLHDQKLVFVEFKNSSYKKIVKPVIRAKIYETIIMLKMKYNLTDTEISTLEFVLVYNREKDTPSTHKISEGRCPKDLKIVEKYLSVKLKVYDAERFDIRSTNIFK